MKSFKEYLTEQEEIQCQQELNEDFLNIAGTVLGYSTAGLLIAWGGALVIKGYTSLAQKAIAGVTKLWKNLFKGKAKASDATKAVEKLRQESTVKVEIEKSKTERDEYAEKLSEVFAAIESKDVDRAIEEFKKTGEKQNPKINRILVGEVVKVFGEPPIHYGNTGNECYLFVKKFLGIKVAQATAALVKEALKKKASMLMDTEEDNNQESPKDLNDED
jgi:hypothetical protein